MAASAKTAVMEYLEAFEQNRIERVAELLHPDFEFVAPPNMRQSRREFLAALPQITALLVRKDVKKIFVDGDEVCVIYDFVTNTAAGAVPSVEWHSTEGRSIKSLYLVFDRAGFSAAMSEAMKKTSAAAPASD
jgi:hypothetical protein